MSRPKLVGSYLNALSETAVAAAAGQVAVLSVGPPGCGKSALLRSFANWFLSPALAVSCDESTPPSRVKGRPHPAALLQGREVTRVEGSLADHVLNGAVIDEITRANPLVWDALLPFLERTRPIVLATANWLVDDDRVQALHDRITFWVWTTPAMTPQMAADIAASGIQRLELERTAPDNDALRMGAVYWRDEWPEPAALRQVWGMAPGRKAAAAIQDAVRALADEALKAGFLPNPRRITQWMRVLYGRTCLEMGTADWDGVADVALRALVHAWPAADESEAATWRQVALRVVDTVGATIEAILGEVKERLQRVAGLSPTERGQQAMVLGRWIAEKQAQLQAIADSRAAGIVATLDQWFRQAITGVDPWAVPDGEDGDA